MWAKETASAGIDVAPLETALAQNVPNPFNPTTTIRFSLAAPGQVTLAVYDVSGRRVRTLVDEYRAADRYHVSWDGRNEAGESVASGVYFYRLVAGRFAQTKKMVLLK
jgi:flagellar hook assembly protein FlgD